MNKKLLPLTIGILLVSLASASMAQVFGPYLNESFWVSAQSTTQQFTIKTPPTISLSVTTPPGQGMMNGIAPNTVVTQSVSGPMTAQTYFWNSMANNWTGSTLSYDVTVGSREITNSYSITIDENGNITTALDEETKSSDGTAWCELRLTPASANTGPSYATLTLQCGDMFGSK